MEVYTHTHTCIYMVGKELTLGLLYDLRCWKMRKMERTSATAAKQAPMITAGLQRSAYMFPWTEL